MDPLKQVPLESPVMANPNAITLVERVYSEPSSVLPDMTDNIVDSYQILEILGQGGMGIVYKALDTSLQKTVALKMMHPVLVKDAQYFKRFKSEAKALGRLHHPHIVNVFALRQIEHQLFIVMEYVEGGSLTDLIRHHGPIPWRDATSIIQQTLRAIGYAHRQKVIHRDIKPSNILLRSGGVAKVTDFGLAKIQDASTRTISATKTGFTGGTLRYMAPEHLEGLSNVDHRGDLYSLGMTYYEMLAGKSPFDKLSSEFAIFKAIDRHDFPSLDKLNRDVPEPLVRIVMKAVERDQGDRFQSADEMLAAMNDWLICSSPHGIVTNRLAGASGPSVYPGHEDQPGMLEKAPNRALKSHKETQAAQWRQRPVLIAAALGIVIILGALLYMGSLGVFESASSPPVNGASTREIGALSVRTHPTEAQVSVDGQRVGTTPLIDYALRPGSHVILVEKPGYVPLDTLVIVDTSETVAFAFSLLRDTTDHQSIDAAFADRPSIHRSAEPVPPPTQDARTSPVGALVILSQPSNATVWLEGSRLGQTPITLRNQSPGTYVLTVRKEGFEDYVQSVAVAPHGTNTVTATLTALTGTLRVLVRPWGSIYIDGKRKATNTNALYTEELPFGIHQVRATHPALGQWEKRITIDQGGTEELLFNFNRQYKVTVTSEPRYAEIVVDGRSTGYYTPSEVMIYPGERAIEVRKAGHALVGSPLVITLERDRTDEPLHFTLRPEH